MKITESHLRKIIKQELNFVLNEADLSVMAGAYGSGKHRTNKERQRKEREAARAARNYRKAAEIAALGRGFGPGERGPEQDLSQVYNKDTFLGLTKKQIKKAFDLVYDKQNPYNPYYYRQEPDDTPFTTLPQALAHVVYGEDFTQEQQNKFYDLVHQLINDPQNPGREITGGQALQNYLEMNKR